MKDKLIGFAVCVFLVLLYLEPCLTTVGFVATAFGWSAHLYTQREDTK